ncbi:gamma tubulin complex Spc97/GCP2 subunit Alp4 [Purpureocillium takamizusanense]|uniref:Spindle pole body component n=1 Tax=Purpureocillium takamizusanense TaxID=2060973 RepID=A0A9Q8VEF1_9HYPO|nr:gamma tubulin complex Spc97/GCP2 subunit Alp4 [Purpureocillium takamizusanense]UNI21752.1 gamma tubulin complex Spc97/GCP2 subunit Alp4 [Purpureocillium takamizusanense]
MSSGTARASASRPNGFAEERERVRAAGVSGSGSGSGSFRSEQRRTTGPGTAPSPQPDGPFPGVAHKRTASGNPRPASRTAAGDERRYEERRVTERTYEARIERTRTTSPEKQQRRSGPAEKRMSDARRPKSSSEARPRESAVAEAAPQAPWNPEVTLLPHTTAPLAPRVSIPPLASAMPQALQPKPLADMSLELQEAAIVEDLLFVFMGFEGQYIRFAKGYDPHEERDRLSGPPFRIMPGLDPSLHDLTKSMLKMATYYSALEAFVDVLSRREFGAVNHALCASVRKFLHDYLIMIAQLETQFLTSDTFTVHILNIHTISTSHLMLQLYSLAQELLKKNALLDDESEEDDDSEDDYDKVLEKLNDNKDLLPGNMSTEKICKGGVVLGIVTKRLETMSGDPAARALLTSLLRDASRPYMKMLNEWLHQGSINDPHSEFLIKEQKSIRRERLEQDYTDEYWERRYTIRDRDVPPQLEAVKDKVLLAGKYLNVVRECGGVDVSKVVTDVPTSFDDSRFLENVNDAYAHANESLMQLLLTTHALPARLRSMKHYFFLDPSDYFSYFLELGASELRKPVKTVNTGKLQSLLDLVLRQPGSIVSLDPFKEDVKVTMNEITLTKALQRVVNITGIEQGEVPQAPASQPMESDKNATGFTSLELDYSVPFPVSLVISRKTVWRYKALFRYLLSLRHLESQLSATWQTQTRSVSWAHKGSNPALEIWKRRAWTLRARMLVFVQQLLYFCTAEVIEPNWTKFMARLDAKDGDADKKPMSRTVDELMQDHVGFLDTCLKECMLTNSKLLRIHSKLMQTCTVFAAYTNWLTRELEKSDPDLSGATKPSTMTADQWKLFQATKAAQRGGAAAASQQQQQDASFAADDAEARVNNLSEIIRKWEGNFSRHLQILLDALNHYAATETVVLLSLCARLSTANQGTEYAGLKPDDDG